MPLLDIGDRLWENGIGDVVADTTRACAAQRFRLLRQAANARYAQQMTLSDQQVQDFIECWRKDFREVLTPAEARAEAMRLLDFFETFAEGLTRLRWEAQRDASAPSTT